MDLNQTNTNSVKVIHYHVNAVMKLCLATAIMLSNVILLFFLANQKRGRTNIMFIILSVSDLLVGLVTLPLTSLSFLGGHTEKSRMLQAFFDIGPPLFSWVMTIIISAERCFVVIYPRLHERFRKIFFNCFIAMSFLATLMASSYRVALAYWDRNRTTTNAKIEKNHIWSALQITAEGMMFLTAGLLQLYLLYHIKQKVRAMEGSRHSATNHGSRVTKSIQLLFVCLVVCYAPHTATYIMREFGLLLYKDQVTDFYFDEIPLFLVYMNSFVNSVILLTRSTNIKRQRDQLVKRLSTMTSSAPRE